MSPDELTFVLHSEIDEIRRRLLAAGATRIWTLDAAHNAWRRAHEQATIAYIDWCSEPGAVRYAVYRAAQDRADAAQDAFTQRTS